jgi:5'-methylthioinosine phosphorylase
MLAIIGGSGLDQFTGLTIEQEELVDTPYQVRPVKVLLGRLGNSDMRVAFLPRHGEDHAVPPHQINYRANLFALHSLGVTGVIAVNAVGGITAQAGPGVILVPDQIIDYTWGREHTFFDGSRAATDSPDQFSATVAHIDFSEPYDSELRVRLLNAAQALQIAVVDGATYAATQGPRLETPAEIRRLQQDGCHLVGMTGMPEAALAREIGLAYACIALSVNWAAGVSSELITMDSIRKVLAQGMGRIQQIVLQAVQS